MRSGIYGGRRRAPPDFLHPEGDRPARAESPPWPRLLRLLAFLRTSPLAAVPPVRRRAARRQRPLGSGARLLEWRRFRRACPSRVPLDGLPGPGNCSDPMRRSVSPRRRCLRVQQVRCHAWPVPRRVRPGGFGCGGYPPAMVRYGPRRARRRLVVPLGIIRRRVQVWPPSNLAGETSPAAPARDASVSGEVRRGAPDRRRRGRRRVGAQLLRVRGCRSQAPGSGNSFRGSWRGSCPDFRTQPRLTLLGRPNQIPFRENLRCHW